MCKLHITYIASVKHLHYVCILIYFCWAFKLNNTVYAYVYMYNAYDSWLHLEKLFCLSFRYYSYICTYCYSTLSSDHMFMVVYVHTYIQLIAVSGTHCCGG